MTVNYQSTEASVAAVSAKDDKGIFAEVSELSLITESDEESLEIGFERKGVTFVATGYNSYENRWGITLAEEEVDLLAKILWVEARGESEEGQKAVVEVIFNRMLSEDYPDTLEEVLSQKVPTVQFASWKLRKTATPTEKEYTSIYEVLNGETDILRDDTCFFATKKLTSDLDMQIGNHYFCY